MMIRCGIGLLFLLVSGGASYDSVETKYSFTENYAEFAKAVENPDATLAELKTAFNDLLEAKARSLGVRSADITPPPQILRFFNYAETRVGEDGKLRPYAYWEALEYIRAYMPQNRTSVWQEIGPSSWGNIAGHWNPGIGRFNAVCEQPGDSSVIYIGAPAGGCWKSVDGGATWRCLTDHLPVIGVTCIAVDYANPRIVYLGTGDGNGGNVPSIGVLKSTDGGESWEPTGLTFQMSGLRKIHRIIINPRNTQTLFAATNDGLYRSENAGQSWTRLENANVNDIEYHPQDTTVVYAMVANTFRKSTDGGLTFSTVTAGLPSASGRTLIAVTPAEPDYVYVLSSRTNGLYQGVYRSVNKGASFTLRSSTPAGLFGYNTDGSSTSQQTWYNLAFAVSPIDANEIHVGAILTWRSRDGGATWRATTAWRYPVSAAYQYTHCDIHAVEIFGNRLYVGSDGLVCKSNNQGDTFRDIVNHQVGVRQFYKIAVAQGNTTKIVGGAQDNGTSYYDGTRWWDWMGADGMDCMVSPDGNTLYGTIQNGRWTKRIGTSNVSMTQPGGGGWVTPAVMHPTNPDILFVGISTMRKSTNAGQSWTSIGLSGSNLTSINISRSDPNWLYATRSSSVYISSNGGTSWNTVSSNGLPDIRATFIAAHPADPREAVVTYGGYTEGRKVFRTTDGGTTWTNISGNLPNIPANCAVYDSRGNLFTGMDIGVYLLARGQENHVTFMAGLPNVVVKDLDMHYSKNLLYAATYGRGLWVADINVVGTAHQPQHSKGETIHKPANFPNPFTYMTTLAFTIPKAGAVTVAVYNARGDRIRTLVNGVLTQGAHTAVWNGRDDAGAKAACGVYLYKIESAEYRDVGRMVMTNK